MKIAIMDFEATSVLPEEAVPLEVACIVVDSQTFEEIDSYERYIKSSLFQSVPLEVENLTKISTSTIHDEGLPELIVCGQLIKMTQDCEIFLAHNKTYDMTVLAKMLGRNFTAERLESWPGMRAENWICTLEEIPYPEKYRCKILSHLALDHGAIVSGKDAHGALYDVQLIQTILRLGKYSIDDIINYARSPWIYLQALIPNPWEDAGKGKDAAKKAGYGWEKARGDNIVFPKKWIKRVKEIDFAKEKTRDEGFKRLIISPTS